MIIRTIKKLEDMKGIKANEPVVVPTTVETGEGNVELANFGFVYNRGIDRFSLIEQVYSGSTFPISPSLKRVSYEWNAGNKTFVSTEIDSPFVKNSVTHHQFESLFKQYEVEA